MTPFEHIRETLNANQSFGVWSLIITLFGDMAQGGQHKISGTALTAICEKLEIKPQAMRVALHRLRKDGWIDSIKTGRKSTYFLTEARQTESAAASSRIYATSPPNFVGTNILYAPSKITKSLDPTLWIATSAEVFVCFENDPILPENGIATHQSEKIPDWLKTRLISADLKNGYQRFKDQLVKIPTDEFSQMSHLETVALRTLIVHDWRRLVLKHPALPIDATPADCPILECYELVTKMLDALPRPDLTEVV